jgi:hypothetical protein
MHPTISYELAKARIADLHRQAERDRIAHAARRARRTQSRHNRPAHPASVLARRMLALLAPRPAPSQPE